jgi:hypothetical protein
MKTCYMGQLIRYFYRYGGVNYLKLVNKKNSCFMNRLINSFSFRRFPQNKLRKLYCLIK